MVNKTKDLIQKPDLTSNRVPPATWRELLTVEKFMRLPDCLGLVLNHVAWAEAWRPMQDCLIDMIYYSLSTLGLTGTTINK